ncbi:hypothetical protein BO221_05270 [Archangium sp. Cb G35]|uniref:hypothetical protein n=1 Tax=Archangium sp. Cb G35 TaxID=1920190 RepID=UPI000935971E|nr:hypothetical protein [Archangium sp. Cb G35]OJT27385.1 hypothetical protein BO221_05270 [Archangium sp. Cb G35]
MSPSPRGLAVLLCAAALLGGCKKEEQPAATEDRTLERLRQEVDRVNQGGAPTAAPDETDPNARLAGLAAGQDQEKARTYALPSKEKVKVDTLALQPTGLESLHSLRGTGKVALTTDELFLRVTLDAENVGPQSVDVSFSTARVVDAGGKEYPLARDAQTLAGTRTLDRTWENAQRDSMDLIFEVPPDAIGPGLSLLIPTRSGENARIPLQ